MTLELAVLVILIAAGLGGLFWFLSRRPKPGEPAENQRDLFLMLQNQIGDIARTLDNKLGESHKSMQVQFGQTAQIVRDVTERLTKLDETNRQVVNFADQLKNLQDILKNPKQRGVLGEYYLETLLKNVLPPGSYQMQYPFNDGTIVDAAVFVKDKIIPVDSKFSLENYNRLVEEKNEAERAKLEKVFVNDLKLRIQETSKYIQPAQNTMDFAFMFIPHEAIYYDLLVNKIGALENEDTENLIQRAASKYRVIIVSPTSFLAYLQTVMQGLRALRIEESAKEIIKRVEELSKHLAGYETYLGKMGNHLGTTVNMYNQVYKEFGKIDKDVLRITGEKNGVEPLVLDRPRSDQEEK